MCVINNYMSEKHWFGARTVYAGMENETRIYEERIIVLLAESMDDAIEKADKEAASYAEDNGMEYLGYVNVFLISDEAIRDKTEVYSLMRESELGPSEYLDTFFDTGKERTQIS